jgi:cell division protein FtsI/penicillin-binding protein 2
MKLLICFLTSALLTAYMAKAQIVISNVKGTVEYSENGQWKKVTAPRQNIRDNTRLRLADNSSCIVVHANGTIVVTCPTAKQVVASPPAAKEESILDKIFATLNGLMSDPSLKGGANIFRGENLMLLPADGELLLQPAVTFIWRNNKSVSYNFYLQEDATEAWLCNSVQVKDTMLAMPGNKFCNKNISSTKTYYWCVKPSSNTGEECYMPGFSVVGATTKAQLEKRLQELEGKKALVDDDVYEVLRSAVYFDLKYYSEAYKVLLSARNKFPGSEVVETGYNTLINNLLDLNTDRDENTNK